jgi:hypothetical protein
MNYAGYTFGDLPLPFRTNQQIEAGFAAIGFAQLAELIRSLILQCIHPKPASEIRRLDDHWLGIQLDEPDAVDDVLVSAGNEGLIGRYIIVQHGQPATWCNRENTIE